jgi:hypothetical protein
MSEPIKVISNIFDIRDAKEEFKAQDKKLFLEILAKIALIVFVAGTYIYVLI